jgi:hypothetical protein
LELLSRGAALDSATALTGVDDMVLHIEVRAERDDWNALASIAEPFKRAIEALSGGDSAKAEAEVRLALRAAYVAAELTDADRRRVIELIKAEYARAKADLDFRGLVPGEVPDLQQLVTVRAISGATAAELGKPSWSDLQLP